MGGPDLVVEDVTVEVESRQKGKETVTEEVLVFRVRPKAVQAGRCSRCRAIRPGYDAGDGLRGWRTLDVGTMKTYLEAPVPRVRCPEHGVVVAHVPWARPGAKHTWLFEDTCAWLAAHAALSVLTVLLRIAWRTAAAIVTRVVADGRDTNDLLAGLTRIGIDETAYRKGHRYLTCVVDHTTGRLVWAGEGRNQDTLGRFFDELGAERATLLTDVSCDGAEWIHALVRARAPQALICLDAFHVVAWAMKALDKVRVRTMTRAGITDRHAMWATRKNPPDLTGEQRTSLAAIADTKRHPVSGVSAQRATPGGVSGQRRPRAPTAGRVAVVGVVLAHTRVRRAGPQHPPLPRPDPQHPRPRPVEREVRGHQHSPARIDQARLWFSQSRCAYRHGHAHPRRTLPTTTRPRRMKSSPRERQ
ncbi:transposase [Mycobacterium pseudokansasii]|uniref:transposase n=1 Tax=Mycobacterium pseudokansasii TaxID=2341080 RepID=UPI0007B4FA10|nr:hypothetical protein A4G27_09950 [Mycobacterium kansasii]VBA31531.1 hypothetical protein LAUMK35_05037 [Mycobacterium pseudokansasii]VBA33373.1 hypothetical protein LAUMK21_04996 [Mycobacterium pseudokansasii]